jgi:Glycosyltransferase Family 4
VTDPYLARGGSELRKRGRRVVLGLFFFPRGGSAQVARALSHALAQAGWEVTLAAGSLGQTGEQTHAPTFFDAVDLVAVDYSPDRRGGKGAVPFQPSYEDRPGAPDRVFATVDDEAYERLVAVWADALDRAGAPRAEALHLHHLTPANEAALRAFPGVPVVGHMHGTELALLRAIEAGAPAGWRFAERWQRRMRGWAGAYGNEEQSGGRRWRRVACRARRSSLRPNCRRVAQAASGRPSKRASRRSDSSTSTCG